MPSRKTTYSIQLVVILAVFFFVFFNLVFKLIVDLRSDPIKKRADQVETNMKKQDIVPKLHLDESLKSSGDLDAEEHDSTEVFIRTPRYGRSFYPSDFPILFEGTALSVTGDFSDTIVWTSNLDGELGKGKKIAVRLSIGDHQITAAGTNKFTTGTMTTRIHVEKEPDFLKEYIKK